jgi:hypothetical protein
MTQEKDYKFEFDEIDELVTAKNVETKIADNILEALKGEGIAQNEKCSVIIPVGATDYGEPEGNLGEYVISGGAEVFAPNGNDFAAVDFKAFMFTYNTKDENYLDSLSITIEPDEMEKIKKLCGLKQPINPESDNL